MEEISDGLKLLTWEEGCKPWLCVSNDDTRPILNKVWLHENGGWAFATDTHRLAMIKADFPEEYRGCGIDSNFLKLATRYKASSLAFDGDWLVIGTPFGEMRSLLTRPSDDPKAKSPKPPRVEKVIAFNEGGPQIESIAFNPRYLKEANDILGGGRNDGVQVTFTGEGCLGPLIVTPQNDKAKKKSFVVVMPMQLYAEDAAKLRQAVRAVADELSGSLPVPHPEPAPAPAKKARKPRAAMVAHAVAQEDAT